MSSVQGSPLDVAMSKLSVDFAEFPADQLRLQRGLEARERRMRLACAWLHGPAGGQYSVRKSAAEVLSELDAWVLDGGSEG